MSFSGAGNRGLKIQKVVFQCLCCRHFSARFVLLFSHTQASSGSGFSGKGMDRPVESDPAVTGKSPHDE